MHLTDNQTDLVVSAAAGRLIDAVDGVRTADEVLDDVLTATATGRTHSAADVEAAWRWLLRRGLLVDADEHLRRVAAIPEDCGLPALAQHGPLLDLLATPDGDRRWRTRRTCDVQVRGHGPTAAVLTQILTASGVPVRSREDTGAPDLVVLAHDHEPPADDLAALVRNDTAHLIGGLRDREGRVGPLVVPGWTACSRCHDLYRSARDPSWRWRRALLAHPAAHPLSATSASTTLLLSTAATLAGEALAFIEGRTPLSCAGTLRLHPDDPRPSVDLLEPHPWCGCIWPSDDLDVSTTDLDVSATMEA